VKRIFTLIIGLALSLLSVTSFAASSSPTKPIAVLDFELLGTSIKTLDGKDMKVEGTLKVFENHTTPLRLDGSLDLEQIRANSQPSIDGRIDLKRRGDSSLSFPKKSYSLDFKKTVALLGMPAEKEWILHSCWADKTCLRNVIGYWQAFQIFPWAPRTEFVEVFINNEYRGLYVVVEKIKLGPSRLNLASPDENVIDGDTGTYILKQDVGEIDYDWKTTVKQPWWLVSPKSVTSSQLDYVKLVTEYLGPIFYAPQYDETIHEQSAADFIIMQELAYNADAYRRSMHLTKYPSSWVNTRPPNNYPNDNRVHMGPIWDLDSGFGNFYHNGYSADNPLFYVGSNDRWRTIDKPAYSVCYTDRWRIDDHPDEVFVPLRLMWDLVLSKEAQPPRRVFRLAISNRWWGLRDDRGRGADYSTISSKRIEDKIDSFAARIGSARARDNRKWDTLGKITWLECWNRSTYQREIDMLKSWIRARIAWMDEQLSKSSFANP
jgi:hypothetical protein